MRPRAKRDFHDLIDMTAMVDIVFFLLIFFLVTSFVGLSAAIQAPRAEGQLGRTARESTEPTSLQPVTVKIDEDGIIWIDQDSVQGVHDLTVRLRAAREETGADGIRIVANPEATHGKVVMVLDAGISAGFEKAQLSVDQTQ
jgi:biopolymer transport protein ExbD